MSDSKFTEHYEQICYGAVSLYLASGILSSPTSSRISAPGSVIVESDKGCATLSRTSKDGGKILIEVEGISPNDGLRKEAAFELPLNDHQNNPLFEQSLEIISKEIGVRLLRILDDSTLKSYRIDNDIKTVLRAPTSDEDQEIIAMIDTLCRSLTTEYHEIAIFNPALGTPATFLVIDENENTVPSKNHAAVLTDPVSRRHLDLAQSWSSRLTEALWMIPFDTITNRYKLRRLPFSLERPEDQAAAIAAAHIVEMKLSAMPVSKT